MTNKPLSEAEEQRARVHAPIANLLGAAMVETLRTTECSCIACQLSVLQWTIRWVLHGEDIRETMPELDTLLRNLFTIRRALRQQARYHRAMDATMTGHQLPDTDGRPN